jgi:hypothetical protein
MDFTERQIANWKTYERVRRHGLYNMFDPRARRLTKLGEEAYSFVMRHYSELKVAAKRSRIEGKS